jgi:hypothetical protein
MTEAPVDQTSMGRWISLHLSWQDQVRDHAKTGFEDDYSNRPREEVVEYTVEQGDWLCYRTKLQLKT